MALLPQDYTGKVAPLEIKLHILSLIQEVRAVPASLAGDSSLCHLFCRKNTCKKTNLTKFYQVFIKKKKKKKVVY